MPNMKLFIYHDPHLSRNLCIGARYCDRSGTGWHQELPRSIQHRIHACPSVSPRHEDYQTGQICSQGKPMDFA